MNVTFPIPFAKMSGTGNDFIVIDHRRPFFDKAVLPSFVRAVCQRKFSVGADGLILIEESDTADFRWQFFNADGSLAEMCGNGARCAARFAVMKGIAPASMRFETIAGTVEAQVSEPEGLVKIGLTPAQAMQLDLRLVVAGGERTVDFINTGVPHAVLMFADLDDVAVDAWGRELRHHEYFMPAGTNVNFVQVTSDHALKVRTYERGVEAETLACGTGAVAAVIISAVKAGVRSPAVVTTSGGSQLTIHFETPDRNTETVNGIFLEGPARFVYEGQLQADAIQGRN